MNFIFASDSFKGSLSSEKTGKILGECLKNEIQDASFSQFLIADGGEGTLDAFLSRDGALEIKCEASNPIFEKISSRYCVLGEKAIIALSEASGLTLIDEEKRNPLYTTTLGTGELVLDALNRGYRDITLAIGGSATNDGGIGAMSALGIKFLDENGEVLLPIGKNLAKIRKIDTSCLVLGAKEAKFSVMCDVTNPLLGENGATHVYGPQKGATPEIVNELESGMQSYARVIYETLGTNANEVIGGGAAGGIGAALSVFLGAKMGSGIDTLLDIVDFDSALVGADGVISGEGRLDSQSLSGKVIYGIAKRCQKAGVPLYLIVGGLGDGWEKAYDLGIKKIYTLVNETTTLAEAINNAEEIYRARACDLFGDIKRSL